VTTMNTSGISGLYAINQEPNSPAKNRVPSTSVSPQLIPSIFAASIVGGFLSIYGAIAGGLLVGLTEVLGTRFLAGEFGSWLIAYRPLIPLVFIVVTLMIAPRGLAGINWSRLRRHGSRT